jgi:hypothetical protein
MEKHYASSRTAAQFSRERDLARIKAESLHVRSLGSLVKARAFGMTQQGM